MKNQIPELYKSLKDKNPDVFKAYEELGTACHEAGPLDDESRRLVKLAIAIAIGSEGAVHSNIRRALEKNISVDKLRHVALLSIPTIGLPKTQAAISWIEDYIK